MSANRSSNGGRNGTANRQPKERVMMVLNLVHDLVVMSHSVSPPPSETGQQHATAGGFTCVLGFPLAEVRAIASMMEKQAQIVVKQKVSVESKTGKEAVLAQYANVTDEEEYPYCHFWVSWNDRLQNTFLANYLFLFPLTKALQLKKRTLQVALSSLGVNNVSFLRFYQPDLPADASLASFSIIVAFIQLPLTESQPCSRTPTWKRC